jgi:hypothetical protein
MFDHLVSLRTSSANYLVHRAFLVYRWSLKINFLKLVSNGTVLIENNINKALCWLRISKMTMWEISKKFRIYKTNLNFICSKDNRGNKINSRLYLIINYRRKRYPNKFKTPFLKMFIIRVKLNSLQGLRLNSKWILRDQIELILKIQ